MGLTFPFLVMRQAKKQGADCSKVSEIGIQDQNKKTGIDLIEDTSRLESKRFDSRVQDAQGASLPTHLCHTVLVQP